MIGLVMVAPEPTEVVYDPQYDEWTASYEDFGYQLVAVGRTRDEARFNCMGLYWTAFAERQREQWRSVVWTTPKRGSA